MRKGKITAIIRYVILYIFYNMVKIVSPLSSKYQITLPAKIREELGINSPKYDIIWIKIPTGDYILRPVKKLEKDENPFLRVFGLLEGYGGDGNWVDEFIKEKREEALKENL